MVFHILYRHFTGTSWALHWHITDTSLALHWHITDTSLALHWHITGISLTHHWHITGTLPYHWNYCWRKIEAGGRSQYTYYMSWKNVVENDNNHRHLFQPWIQGTSRKKDAKKHQMRLRAGSFWLKLWTPGYHGSNHLQCDCYSDSQIAP